MKVTKFHAVSWGKERGERARAALGGGPAPRALGAGAWGPDTVQGLSS